MKEKVSYVLSIFYTQLRIASIQLQSQIKLEKAKIALTSVMKENHWRYFKDSILHTTERKICLESTVEIEGKGAEHKF